MSHMFKRKRLRPKDDLLDIIDKLENLTLMLFLREIFTVYGISQLFHFIIDHLDLFFKQILK
jgi:hypothetical protein